MVYFKFVTCILNTTQPVRLFPLQILSTIQVNEFSSNEIFCIKISNK